MDDKEILYNMFRREVTNYLSRCCPSFAPFSSFIANKIIAYADPYVSMFIDQIPGQASTQLKAAEFSAFAEEELSDKIAKFRAKYESERSAAKGEVDGEQQ